MSHLIERAQKAHAIVPSLVGEATFEMFSLLLLTGDKVIVSR